MLFKSRSLIFFFFFFLLTFSLSVSEIKSNVGFSVELIHYNSPKSPFHDATKTPSDLIKRAASIPSVNSSITPRDISYSMRISIGTPPVPLLAMADTGSDLVWVRCKPGEESSSSSSSSPFFNPQNSSTYTNFSCNADTCQLLDYSECRNLSKDPCTYLINYMDSSYAEGILSSDVFSFSEEMFQFPGSAFGCAHEVGGPFQLGVAGIVGLGTGSLSLISRLGPLVGYVFSYCLPIAESNSTSFIRFGRLETKAKPHEQTLTTLVFKPDSTKYYLTLKHIKVGDKSVNAGNHKGNILINSGTTLTYLTKSLHQKVESAMKKVIGNNIEPVSNPPWPFTLCYGSNFVAPNITFGFSGANLMLRSFNTFQVVDGLMCLLIVPTTEGDSTFGSLAHVNFLVEYDQDNMQISFTPQDCSKLH